MRTNKQTGTTLVELLVVIVVFLVGILAIVQVFPPGLNVLRTTRNNTIAAQLGSAEMQRIQGQSGQVAEMIVPVNYFWTVNGVRVTIDTTRLTRDMMPAKDPGNAPGLIDANGNVIVGGNSIGNWQKVSGSNLISRVIGESKPVPGPRRVPGLPAGLDFGGVYNLTFAPAYYFPTPAGIGESGLVQAYGNDLAKRYGDREYNNPNPNRRPVDGEYFFVQADDTDASNFTGEDQVWIGPTSLRRYRVAFSFAYDQGGQNQQYDVIVQIDLDPANPPSYAMVVGNYWVVSMQKIIGLTDVYGKASQFLEANYKYADPDSVRVQRLFQEIASATAFDVNDPYQYKVIGTGNDPATGLGFSMGTLLFNPAGFNYRVRSSAGPSEVLQARVDYSVFDWRLLKDEFRVPTPESVGGSLLPKDVKLPMGGIKPLGATGPDNKLYQGTGLLTPTLTTLTGTQTDDVIMLDIDTGAVVLGGKLPSQNPQSGWSVDKTFGQIAFHDADNLATNGLSAYLCFPTGNPTTPWTAPQLINDVSNRNVRVLYMGRAEWSVQPLKAARTYRVSGYIGTGGMGPGECFVGGTLDTIGNAVGRPYRLYFAPFDLGQKVIVGELWSNTGAAPSVLYDQEFQIAGIENVNGLDLAYADVHDKLPAAAVFDWSQGYAVRRVRGASMKVRVLWNPSSFFLTADQQKNYNDLEVWMRNWRRTENESLQIGGRN